MISSYYSTWWNVLGCTTEGPCFVSRENLLRETEIDDFDVTFAVDHQVLWFKISVNILSKYKFSSLISLIVFLPFVKIRESFKNAANIETSICIAEWSFRMKQAPQIAAEISICKKVYEFVVFEGFVKSLENSCIF